MKTYYKDEHQIIKFEDVDRTILAEEGLKVFICLNAYHLLKGKEVNKFIRAFKKWQLEDIERIL